MTKKAAEKILQNLKEGNSFEKNTIDVALFITGDINHIPSLKIFRCLPVVVPNWSKKESPMCQIIESKPVAYVTDVNGENASIISVNAGSLKIGMVLYDLPPQKEETVLHKKIARLQTELVGMSAELERVRKLLDEAWGE